MMRKSSLMALSVLAAVALAFGTGVAHAQLSGPKALMAFGGAVDSLGNNEDGHMALAGWMNLTKKGGAKAVNVTVTYQDSFNSSDGFVCAFTDPADVSYSFPNGLNSAGTLTLTLAQDDPECYEMADPSVAASETGNSITFTIYREPGAFSLVGAETTLVDADSDTIASPIPVSGTMLPAVGSPKNRLNGVKLFNAIGGTTDNSRDSGHIALAGRATLNGNGGAKALDLTLTYIDSRQDEVVCQLTTPSDLTYTITKGVGTLTLQPSASDSNCTPNEVGTSIAFSLFAVGGQTRLIATSSSLVDSEADVINSLAMSGSM